MADKPDFSKVESASCKAALNSLATADGQRLEALRAQPREKAPEIAQEINRHDPTARAARREARREAREERAAARAPVDAARAHVVEACGGVDLTCIETLKAEGQLNAGKIPVPDSLKQTADTCRATGRAPTRPPRPGS